MEKRLKDGLNPSKCFSMHIIENAILCKWILLKGTPFENADSSSCSTYLGVTINKDLK